MNKLAAALLMSLVTSAHAGVITTYTDRAAFNADLGPHTLEDFTDTYHYPIPGGVLDSNTSFVHEGGQLNAGDIEPGVRYSTPVGEGNYFNIDAGGGFEGGFLDGFNPVDRDLTIRFDVPASGFGFDTNDLMPNFDLTVLFSDGTSWVQSVTGVQTQEMTFFGYRSSAADIESVVISGYGSNFGFAIDNFAFDTPAQVPEPSALALLGLGALGIGAARRRRG